MHLPTQQNWHSIFKILLFNISCYYCFLFSTDQISIEELDVIYKIPHCVPISAHHKWNFDDLLEKMWQYLKLMRMYISFETVKKSCGCLIIYYFLSVTRNQKDNCPTTMPQLFYNLIGALWRNSVTNCIALFSRNSNSNIILDAFFGLYIYVY